MRLSLGFLLHAGPPNLSNPFLFCLFAAAAQKPSGKVAEEAVEMETEEELPVCDEEGKNAFGIVWDRLGSTGIAGGRTYVGRM